MIKKILNYTAHTTEEHTILMALIGILSGVAIVFVVGIFLFIISIGSVFSIFDVTKSGQLGDTFNGIVGPFLALIAAGLTFLAFWAQYNANKQQREDIRNEKLRTYITNFETNLFELIQLHRDNVSEMLYSKYEQGGIQNFQNRKVFHVIFKEFIECLHDIRKLTDQPDPALYYTAKHLKKVKAYLRKNKAKTNLIEYCTIDIAYTIVFYGVAAEGEMIIKNTLRGKYNENYLMNILAYLRLKPKEEITFNFQKWKRFRGQNQQLFLSTISNIRFFGKRGYNIALTTFEKSLNKNAKLYKYYGGHQHRLGHYFRNLYQLYYFLDTDSTLTNAQKIGYSDIARAQLSTYEQTLLFIHSISSIGIYWELYPPTDKIADENSSERISRTEKLITKYNIICNLPGKHTYGIYYKSFYPNVNYI